VRRALSSRASPCVAPCHGEAIARANCGAGHGPEISAQTRFILAKSCSIALATLRQVRALYETRFEAFILRPQHEKEIVFEIAQREHTFVIRRGNRCPALLSENVAVPVTRDQLGRRGLAAAWWHSKFSRAPSRPTGASSPQVSALGLQNFGIMDTGSRSQSPCCRAPPRARRKTALNSIPPHKATGRYACVLRGRIHAKKPPLGSGQARPPKNCKVAVARAGTLKQRRAGAYAKGSECTPRRLRTRLGELGVDAWRKTTRTNTLKLRLRGVLVQNAGKIVTT